MASLFNIKFGARLPDIESYAHMLVSMACPTDNPGINDIGLVTAKTDDHYFLVESRQGYCQAMPGGEFSPRLYRGQTGFYSLCKPGVFRVKSYADMAYWVMKAHELFLLLRHHPALAELGQPDFLVNGYSYDFNPYATAQHYGYPTHFLDLTRSYDMALFFATHHVHDEGRRIVPAVGETAVIYIVDLKSLVIDSGHRIMPIGLDPLPRPAMQKAFALPLDIRDNFNEIDSVSYETFLVTEELASAVLERLGGVENIFPYDPFQDLITDFRDNKKIAMPAINLAYEAGLMPGDINDPNEVAKMLEEAGYIVTDNEQLPPFGDILEKSRQEWARRRESFYSRLHFRAVSDRRQEKPP